MYIIVTTVPKLGPKVPIRPQAGIFVLPVLLQDCLQKYYSPSCNNTDYYAGADFGIIVSLPARLAKK